MAPTGSFRTRLVVLRGNSGAGKSSTAHALRQHLGRRLALIEQDTVRRRILKERDVPGGANIALLSTITRFSLDHGWDVVLEGIMHADRYDQMLADLCRDHLGQTACFYFDVSFEESLRRHATRPKADEFGAEDMRQWFQQRDLLAGVEEQIVPESATLDDTVTRILTAVFPEQATR